MLTYGSICSGIGSEAVAWDPLGWKPKWFAEVNSLCSRLLKSRYPHVPNLGDIRRIQHAESVNLVVGGTPCQSFSINGLRKGMSDNRGKLSWEFVRIVAETQPAWVVWENVPNVLQIEGGKAFGSVVGALGECGYGWSYRVLDLRRFGIPQRRRRLFLVGFLGDGRPAVASLFNPLPDATHCTTPTQARQGSVAGTNGHLANIGNGRGDVAKRYDGWAGDETPKRAKGTIPTLKGGQGGEGIGVIEGKHKMRRLTTTEWERLQGFPVGYTDMGLRTSVKERQLAIGNSFPPPILCWLGVRIDYLSRVLGVGGYGDATSEPQLSS